jgi:hypothetical protein
MLSLRLLFVMLLVLTLDLCFVLLLQTGGSAAFYQENSLLENAQLAVLAACIAAHAWRQRRTVAVAERRFFVALGLLALAIFYRESDLQSLLAPESALRAALYVTRRIVGPLLWLAAALALGRVLASGWSDARSVLASEVALLAGGFAVMMVIAALLDKSVIHLPGPNRLYEELLELSAYLLLLFSAFAMRAEIRGGGTRGCALQRDPSRS